MIEKLQTTNNTKTKMQNVSATEQLGRTFSGVRFEVHFRRVGTNRWLGNTAYSTQADAQKEIDKMGEPDPVDEFIGRPNARYEYRIVRREYTCTVVHLETKQL